MGGRQSNYVSASQNVFTDVLNVSTEKCDATCNQSNTGNVVIIEGGETIGDVDILNNTCTVNAKCIMQNTVSTDIANVVSATLQQKNTDVTSLFSGFKDDQNNVAITSQNISNYITQVLVSTCQSDSWQNNSGNFFYFGDNAGNIIALNNNGNVSASCTMTNLSKITVSNKATSEVTQSNVAVGGFILFAIILIIILLLTRGKKGGGSSDNSSLQDLENLVALQALK
jgi:hypothetical protein